VEAGSSANTRVVSTLTAGAGASTGATMVASADPFPLENLIPPYNPPAIWCVRLVLEGYGRVELEDWCG
jgi:hypothetical protein